MPAQPSATLPAKEPAKSKLLLIGAIVVVLVVLAAAALLFLNARNQNSEVRASSPTAVVPTFLPLDNMVVNLADPGGDRFVQIGITLELLDDKTAKLVKDYLPSIRNGVLMLVSQQTSDELLTREGKEQLATAIREEVSRPLGFAGGAARARADDGYGYEESPRPRQNPVRRVLFSSFIIQ